MRAIRCKPKIKEAAERGDLTTLRLILKESDLPREGSKALAAALWSSTITAGHLGVIRYLLERGVPLLDRQMEISCMFEGIALIRILLPYADVTPRTLECALYGRDLEVIRALLATKVEVRDRHREYARLEGETEMLALLIPK